MVATTKKSTKGAKGAKGPKGAKKGLVKKTVTKYWVDCQQPCEDNIMDIAQLEKYLQDRIKVNGKTGNLGDMIKIGKQKNKVSVSVSSELEKFSKRYIKYLSKKYLKKQNLRDFLHVIAQKKESYQLKYFNINSNDDDDE